MTELSSIDFDDIPRLARNTELQQCLTQDVREYFKTYSIPLEVQVTHRLSQALSTAVSKLYPNRLNNMRITHLSFGAPPAYVFPVGAGYSVYIPDMSLSPIATTWGANIYLDAPALAALETEPFDLAAVFILEEFVHSLFGVADESMAKNLTCSLFGGIVFDGIYRVKPPRHG